MAKWIKSSLEISEGAIANLLLRVKEQLQSSVDGIVQRLRSSRPICSDETSARVNGKNKWEWVFQNDQVCLHVIGPSRGEQALRASRVTRYAWSVIFRKVTNGFRSDWGRDLASCCSFHCQYWQTTRFIRF